MVTDCRAAGNEGDTLGSDTVIVYDSDHFPAHVVAWTEDDV